MSRHSLYLPTGYTYHTLSSSGWEFTLHYNVSNHLLLRLFKLDFPYGCHYKCCTFHTLVTCTKLIYSCMYTLCMYTVLKLRFSGSFIIYGSTKSENVRAIKALLGHFVCTLFNSYFKLCMLYLGCILRHDYPSLYACTVCTLSTHNTYTVHPHTHNHTHTWQYIVHSLALAGDGGPNY